MQNKKHEEHEKPMSGKQAPLEQSALAEQTKQTEQRSTEEEQPQATLAEQAQAKGPMEKPTATPKQSLAKESTSPQQSAPAKESAPTQSLHEKIFAMPGLLFPTGSAGMNSLLASASQAWSLRQASALETAKHAANATAEQLTQGTAGGVGTSMLQVPHQVAAAVAHVAPGFDPVHMGIFTAFILSLLLIVLAVSAIMFPSGKEETFGEEPEPQDTTPWGVYKQKLSLGFSKCSGKEKKEVSKTDPVKEPMPLGRSRSDSDCSTCSSTSFGTTASCTSFGTSSAAGSVAGSMAGSMAGSVSGNVAASTSESAETVHNLVANLFSRPGK